MAIKVAILTGLICMRPMNFPRLEDLFVGDLGVDGNWVVANIEGSIAWPNGVTKASFRSRDVYLIPYTQDTERDLRTFPAVAINLRPDETFQSGQILLSHFLSTLSWIRQSSISVANWTGGNLPRPMGGCKFIPIIGEKFYEPYFPDPQDRRARLALALYREGLSLNHVAYQCLSFFKILNVLFAKSVDQIAWMNARFSQITAGDAAKRLRDVAATHDDVGAYLYGSNRCAVAHAHSSNVADPESPEDERRLRDDFPLVRRLAEIAIESEFGVKSAATIYREHLYELEGLKEFFGADKVEAIRSGAAIEPAEFPEIPNLSIRLALHEPYEPYENMTCQVVACEQGAAIVRCVSKSRFAGIHLVFHFREERLMIGNSEFADDGSASAARTRLQTEKFELGYLLNGILEVRLSADNRLLGRCDPYIPTNIDFGGTVEGYKRRIGQIETAIQQRADHQ